MNKIYKVIWNTALNKKVVVHELASNRCHISSTQKILKLMVVMGLIGASYSIVANAQPLILTGSHQVISSNISVQSGTAISYTPSTQHNGSGQLDINSDVTVTGNVQILWEYDYLTDMAINIYGRLDGQISYKQLNSAIANTFLKKNRVFVSGENAYIESIEMIKGIVNKPNVPSRNKDYTKFEYASSITFENNALGFGHITNNSSGERNTPSYAMYLNNIDQNFHFGEMTYRNTGSGDDRIAIFLHNSHVDMIPGQSSIKSASGVLGSVMPLLYIDGDSSVILHDNSIPANVVFFTLQNDKGESKIYLAPDYDGIFTGNFDLDVRTRGQIIVQSGANVTIEKSRYGSLRNRLLDIESGATVTINSTNAQSGNDINVDGDLIYNNITAIDNVVTGTGTIYVSTLENDTKLAIGVAQRFDGYQGNLVLTKGIFELTDRNATTLEKNQNMTFTLEDQGIFSVVQDTSVAGKLALNGGTLSLVQGIDFTVNQLDVDGGNASNTVVELVTSADSAPGQKDGNLVTLASVGAIDKIVDAQDVSKVGVEMDMVIAGTGTTYTIDNGMGTDTKDLIAQFDYTKAVTTATGIDAHYVISQLTSQSQAKLSTEGLSGAQAVNAVLTGAGGFTFNAEGATLSLNKSNSYLGETFIEAGIISARADLVLGQTSRLYIEQGARFNLNNYHQTIGILDNQKNSIIDLGDSGQAELVIQNGGVSQGMINGKGSIVINNGMFTIASNNNFDGTVTLNNSANLTIGNTTENGSYTSEKVTIQNNTTNNIIFDRSSDTIYAGRILGAGGIVSNGAGNLFLQGDNQYAGETVVNHGSITVTSTDNFGKGAIVIAENAAFNYFGSGSFTFENMLKGNGLLHIQLGQTSDQFNLGQIGSDFSGALMVERATFNLSGNNLLPLTQAPITLSVGQDGIVSIDQDTTLQGDFIFSGGQLNTTMNGTTHANVLTVNQLMIDHTKDNSINIDMKPDDPGNITVTGNLLTQGSADNGGIKIVAANDIEAGSMNQQLDIYVNGQRLEDEDGYAFDIMSPSNTSIGKGYYQYQGVVSQNQSQKGIYIAYVLTKLDSQSMAENIVLNTEFGGQSVGDISYGVELTGAGGYTFMGNNDTITLLNGANNYRGETEVLNGILALGNHQVLGETSKLSLKNQSIVNMGSYSQTIGELANEQDSLINFSGGSLTVTQDSTSSGQIKGAGSLIVGNDHNSIELKIHSDLQLAGEIEISQGSSLIVENDQAGALSNDQLIINGSSASSHVIFSQSNESRFDGVITGHLNVNIDGGKFTLSGHNSYVGNTIVNGAELSITADDNLGANDNVLTLENNSHLMASDALHLAQNIELSGSNQITAMQDLILSGDIENAMNASTGILQKLGSGRLILTGNNQATETDIQSGSVQVGSQGEIGSISGKVTLNDRTELIFNRSNDYHFTGEISGDGGIVQDGTGQTIFTTAQNYTGGSTVNHGTLTLKDNGAISGSVLIQADGELAIDKSGNQTFNNHVTGSGRLTLTLSGDQDELTFGQNVGKDFTGMITVAQSTFNLTGDNLAAFDNNEVTLAVGSGSIIKVKDNVEIKGNLSLDGGQLEIDMISGDEANVLSVNQLTIGDIPNGSVNLVMPSLPVIGTPSPSNKNLLDEGTLDIASSIQLIAANSVDQVGKQIDVLIDGESIDPNAAQTVNIIGGTAAYNYSGVISKNTDPNSAEQKSAGLYLGYLLTKLNSSTGITLDTEGKQDYGFGVELTGSGGYTFEGRDKTITLMNGSNNYLGATIIESGTLQLGASNALGRTIELQVKSGTTFDLNGYSQTIGELLSSSGSVVDLKGGSLTIWEGGISYGALKGTGELIIEPSLVANNNLLQIHGANNDLNAQISIMENGGLSINHVEGIGSSTVFLEQSGILALDQVQGRVSNVIAGVGDIHIKNQSDVVLDHLDHKFLGVVDIESDSILTAETQVHLSHLKIQEGATFNLVENQSQALVYNIEGTGEINKIGLGKVTLDDTFLTNFEGVLNVQSGTVSIDSVAGYLQSAMNIEPEASLFVQGKIDNNVTNKGHLALVENAEHNDFSHLMVEGELYNEGVIDLTGDYIGNHLEVYKGIRGNNGQIILNTILGGDQSLSDRIILSGGDTTGETGLIIQNRGGTGDKTNVGILLVDAQYDATTGYNAFYLDELSDGYRFTTSTIALGAYDYQLVKGGNGGHAESWYLTSKKSGGDLRPEVSSYAMSALMARNMFTMSLDDRRLSELSVDHDNYLSAWVISSSDFGRMNMFDNNFSNRTRQTTLTFGLDVARLSIADHGHMYLGILGGWGHANVKTSDRLDHGPGSKLDMDAYTIGAYGTWYQNDKNEEGIYTDLWLQYSWYNHHIKGEGLHKESYKGKNLSASIELGYNLKLWGDSAQAIYLKPQMQVIYSHYHSNGHREISGTEVRLKDTDGLTTRLGARLYGEWLLPSGIVIRPYAEANWWHHQRSGSVWMDQDKISIEAPKNYGQFKLGAFAELDKNWEINAHVGTKFGQQRYRDYNLQLGVRYTW